MHKPFSPQKKGRQYANTSRKRRFISVITVPFLPLVIAVAILALLSCSNSTPTATPNEHTLKTSGTSYPMTVTDILGRNVQIDQPPVRIVTISPTSTEMLYLLGGTAIGRDASSKYPPEAQDLPTVGSVYSPSIEAIATLNPDLVIIEALNQSRFLSALSELNTKIVVVRATSLEDILAGLTLIGDIIDKKEASIQTIAEIRDRIAAAKGKLPETSKILILISDANRNIYAAKPESYPGAIAALLGLENLATGLPDSGPYPGFSLFSGEQAITSEPDSILTISPAPPPAPSLSMMLPQVPGYNTLTAINTGKVYELDPALFLQAQGPRIADAVEALLDLLNGD
ncbi:ABC transporter substrate-binding protein [Chloroflexota bacterium]